MSARYLSMAMVLALAAVSPARADSAKGGSDDARTIGSRHHSRSGSRSTPTAVRSGGGSAPSRLSDAQSRHPRAGTGNGPSRHSYGRSRGYYRPYSTYHGYGAFPYFDFYYGYGYGHGYYGHGYYGSPYYRGGSYGGRYYGGDFGSVRVLVDPSETRVYVDGYYAGTADDFDGLFQRLHVAPGRHDLALKLGGYRSHRMSVYVPYDGTLKIHYDMVKGGGEETFEDMAGDGDADDPRGEGSWRRPEPGEDRWRDERRERADQPRREGSFERRSTDEERTGTLRLAVRPEEASIYVDGEFRGTARTLQRLQLPAGSHRVEILHPGLRSFERDVTLQSGEGLDLEVELTK